MIPLRFKTYVVLCMAIKYFGLQLWHIGLTPASGITLCLAYIPLEFWVSVEWAPTAISVSNVVGSSSLVLLSEVLSFLVKILLHIK